MLCVVRTYSFCFFSSGINLDLNEEFNMIDIFERTLDIFHIVSFYPSFTNAIASRYLPAIQNAAELFSAEFQVTVLTEGELDRYQQPKKKTI